MCSEALWWRCHRRVVADRLAVTGSDVLHIAPDTRAHAHRLPEFATLLADGRIVYSGQATPTRPTGTGAGTA
jgi:uncharacterized protein (DUF488 family)